MIDGLFLAIWLVVQRIALRLRPPLMRWGARPVLWLWHRWLKPFASKAKSGGTCLAAAVARLPRGIRMGAFTLFSAGIALLVWHSDRTRLLLILGLPDYEIPRLLPETAILVHVVMIERLAPLVAVIGGIATLCVFWRRAVTLWLCKATAAGYTLLVAVLLFLVWRAPAFLYGLDPDLFDGPSRNQVWVKGTVRLLLLVLPAGMFLLMLLRRSVSNHYRREQEVASIVGDRIVRNLRTHGRDPRYRKAQYMALFLHVFVILILPFILTWGGCRMQPYGVPKGSGVTAIQVVKVVQQQEQEQERRYVFDMDTAISFYVPKIDESEIFDQVTRMTEHTYTAQEVGRLGDGGGTTGGWPDGMEDARVRFIRLQYAGGSWDQNMGYGSDYNVLLVFRQMTGFNIWHETESIRIGDLRRFPRRRAPPFVYLAGGYDGGISLSQSEIRTLRDYCLNMGGMIFADNGGGQFDRHFRNVMRQVFPDLPMVEIPHDDVIFQAPFRFPRGAPPLWQISGSQAMGIRYRGRWVVFYHQGNMGAAWRDGHSDAHASVVSQAYQLAVNVIAYSFNQYMQINFGGSIPR